jgi:FMN-dependent oxidoreductase (nitrilotriacetate monooxygenase family)
VEGPLNVPRPPQGHPVLFQAGASEQGRALAARRAEAIYAVAWDLPAAQAYYRDIKRRVQAAGRSAPVPILPGLVPYVAATVEEAQAKQQELDSLLPVAASLRQLGLFTAQDCMSWELDAPVPPLPSLEAFPGPKGRYSTILRIIATEHPTVRQLLGRLAAGGGHCTLVGTPEQIADQMEDWFVNEGADGFNLMPPLLPDGLEDFVEQVVPVLQRRGLFRTAYESATLRGHLGLDRPCHNYRPSSA